MSHAVGSLVEREAAARKPPSGNEEQIGRMRLQGDGDRFGDCSNVDFVNLATIICLTHTYIHAHNNAPMSRYVVMLVKT